MKRLTFNLLGGAEIRRDGQLLTRIGLRKARALLYYLVTTGQASSRIALAGLLWGDLPEANARRNLRKVLTRLRQHADDSLQITRHTVAMRPDLEFQVDVSQFRKLTAPQTGVNEWRSAVTLYQGDFLDGFYVSNAPEFEYWMLGQRALLRDKAVTCLQQIATYLTREGNDVEAISYTKRLLDLEPLREESHRLLMTLYARSGQAASALAQYETCRQILASELDIEPDSETQQLFLDIRQRNVRAQAPATGAPSNLPLSTTAFIGREAELDELTAHLQNPDVRLLTIVGMGGAGKTRLALSLASQLADDNFPDGRFFSSFEALHFSDASNEESVRATLAVNMLSSLNVPLSPKDDPFRQLSEHLRQRRLLLILDNFEPLLLPGLEPKVVRMVQEILEQAPYVMLLLTSRQPLYLRAEWIYDIDGLPLPMSGDANEARSASVRLFNETARRQDRHFDVDAERAAVRQICRLVGGLPLGIELAAGLIREKRCSEIATEIALTLEGVATKWHDLPPRQRSLKATFEYTWQMLTKPERQLLSMLSYMRRSLSNEAARVLAGNLMPMLDRLAAKSLVRFQDARIYLHEVIVEFARRELDEVPEWLGVVSEKHAHYFLDQLETIEHGLETGDDFPIGLTLRPDLENIRTAWRWAVESRNSKRLNQAVRGLMSFFYNMGWLSEGMALLEGAVQALRPGQEQTLPALINCLSQQGLLAALGTDIARASKLSALSAQHLEALASRKSIPDLEFLQAQHLFLQGYIAHGNADWSTARTHLTKAAIAFHHLNRAYDETRAYFVIGNGWMGERQWGKVIETSEKVRALCRAAGNLRLEAKTLATMAVAYSSANKPEKARACREQAQELSAHITWPVRDEVVWLGLAADQALDAGYLDEAARHIAQAAPLVFQSGSMFYEDWNHIQQGHLLLQIGDYEKALDHYERARTCAAVTDKPAMVAFTLTCLCMLCYRWGKTEWLAQHAQALSEVTKQLDDEYYLARAASWNGFTLLALNQAEKAAPSFLQALAETSDEICLCEAQWGVMNCYQQMGDQKAAYESAIALRETPRFENLPAMVTESLLPYQIYYDCWRVLRPVNPGQAGKVLQTAGDHIRDRLHRIENQEWKKAYFQEATFQGRFPIPAV
jgi:DNA-binding SARP family transcriptional activator/predicted ATPase